MRSRLVVVLSVTLSLVVAGACGSDSDDGGDAATATTRKTTTTVAAAAVALEARLIKNVPAGYTQEPDDVGDTGPSDLAKAVNDDGAGDARDVLTKAGFVAGYQRLWTSGENEIINFLYQFSNPTGAADYMARQVAGLLEGDTDPSVTVTQFTVAGVPGAKGISAQAAEGSVVVVVFTRGNYLAQVVISGTDATITTANALAGEQYANVA